MALLTDPATDLHPVTTLLQEASLTIKPVVLQPAGHAETAIYTGLVSGTGGGLDQDDIDAVASAVVAAITASPIDVNAVTGAWPTNPVLATDTRLDNLDATVSSRLAAAAYVAPDNAGIAAIPTNPVLATDTRLDNLDATVSSRLAAAAYVAPDIAAAVVAALNETTIPVDAKKMNGANVIGIGSENDPWRGVGVQP